MGAGPMKNREVPRENTCLPGEEVVIVKAAGFLQFHGARMTHRALCMSETCVG